MEARAALGSPDSLGDTALHLAATAGNSEALRVLLGSGASCESRNRAGRTPLEEARQSEQAACVSLLEREEQMAAELQKRLRLEEDPFYELSTVWQK